MELEGDIERLFSSNLLKTDVHYENSTFYTENP